MRKEEAEQYLFCAMSIGEQLLESGAEVSRVEDTIRRICMSAGITTTTVMFQLVWDICNAKKKV